MNPDIPHNAGLVRPVTITIPQGTILNAAYPAATTYGNHLCPNNADAIMRALGPVIPKRVTADWNEALISQSTGQDPGGTAFPRTFSWTEGGSGVSTDRRLRPHRHDRRPGGILDQDYEISSRPRPTGCWSTPTGRTPSAPAVGGAG
jgi:N-methylhydantoinase B